MEPIAGLLTIAVVSLLGAISPGPDFFIVLRNSLVYSRKSGLLTAIGVSIALIVHITYTLVGIGVVIAESPFLYSIIKYVGVAYLFYLGSKSLISSFKKAPPVEAEVDLTKSRNHLTNKTAFMQGFMTNLLNPKAALFFISLFSQFIDPSTSAFIKMQYGFVNWFVTLSWFMLLAYIVTAKQLLDKVHTFQIYIDRVMGCALMLLGVKLLLV